MPTNRELYAYLDSVIPKSLSCDWDNDGLMCCNMPDSGVRRLLITLDITDDVIEYAKSAGFDTIISHHPLIFKGIKALNAENGVSKRLFALIDGNITAMSFHTRLDAVTDGVNDALSEVLELTGVRAFYSEGVSIGRVGELQRPMNPGELALFIKNKLHAPYVNFNGGRDVIKTLAVLGGAGKDEITAALQTGAQAYLTGELGHHALTDAADYDITLFEAGHHFTEFPVCKTLEKRIKNRFPEIITEIYNSYGIKTV